MRPARQAGSPSRKLSSPRSLSSGMLLRDNRALGGASTRHGVIEIVCFVPKADIATQERRSHVTPAWRHRAGTTRSD